jgi:hypothetical protein
MPTSEFYRHTSTRDRLSSYCKPCQREVQYASPSFRERRQHLKKYGLSFNDFMQLMERQGGVCAICGMPPPEGRHLDVDHCHSTGHVRGLLCNRCNNLLQRAKDNPGVLMRAADYLNRLA